MSGDTVVGQGGVINTGLVGGNVVTNVTVTTTTTLSAAEAKELAGHLAAVIAAAKAGPAADFASEKIETLEKAKAELDKNDTGGALSTLKSAGAWLFDFATKVGQTLAAAYLKTKLGF